MDNIKCPSCGRMVSGISASCPFCSHSFSTSQANQSGTYYNENEVYQSRKASNRLDHELLETMNQAGVSGQYQEPEKKKTIPNRYQNSKQERSALQREELTARSPKADEPRPVDKPQSVSEGTGSGKRTRSRAGMPGRKLIGFRQGSFLHMWFSMIYHLAAGLFIVFCLARYGDFAKDGLGTLYLLRTGVSAVILLLPALLLSDTTFHNVMPLLHSKNRNRVIIGVLIFLVPLLLVLAYLSLKLGRL